AAGLAATAAGFAAPGVLVGAGAGFQYLNGLSFQDAWVGFAGLSYGLASIAKVLGGFGLFVAGGPRAGGRRRPARPGRRAAPAGYEPVTYPDISRGPAVPPTAPPTTEKPTSKPRKPKA